MCAVGCLSALGFVAGSPSALLGSAAGRRWELSLLVRFGRGGPSNHSRARDSGGSLRPIWICGGGQWRRVGEGCDACEAGCGLSRIACLGPCLARCWAKQRPQDESKSVWPVPPRSTTCITTTGHHLPTCPPLSPPRRPKRNFPFAPLFHPHPPHTHLHRLSPAHTPKLVALPVSHSPPPLPTPTTNTNSHPQAP